MTAEGLCFEGLSILLPSTSCLHKTHQSFHNGTDFPRPADPTEAWGCVLFRGCPLRAVPLSVLTVFTMSHYVHGDLQCSFFSEVQLVQ